MKTLSLSILITYFSIGVFADGQFKSRPDLSPPQLNFSSYYNPDTSELAEGYLFLTPYSADSDDVEKRVLQPGAYIFTDSGDLVWSGFSYFGGQPFNFQTANIDNVPILFAFEGIFSLHGGHGHGHIKFLDQNYKAVKELRAGNHELVDIHEFQLADDGKHALIETYSATNHYDLSEFNGGDSSRNWIINAIFQEVDIETNELLFEWKSLDHVSPSHSVLNLSDLDSSVGYQSPTAWDYFHINSVDKNLDGDYLISSRHTSTIYKISHKTGEIIWRLSTSTESDFNIVGEKFTFGFQHHARFVESAEDGTEIISFFDNSAFSQGHTVPSAVEDNKNGTQSSGKIIKLNIKNKTVELLSQYNPPKEHFISAKSQGSLQLLPNGNKLINWGSAGAVTEYKSNGDVLYHVKLDSKSRGDVTQSYRAFKYKWEGYSTEDVAVYYELDQDFTNIYISWNGDTQTKHWDLINAKNGKFIARVNKESFETTYTFKTSSAPAFSVKAIDAEGNVLKESSIYGEPISEEAPFRNYFDWLKAQKVFSV